MSSLAEPVAPLVLQELILSWSGFLLLRCRGTGTDAVLPMPQRGSVCNDWNLCPLQLLRLQWLRQHVINPEKIYTQRMTQERENLRSPVNSLHKVTPPPPFHFPLVSVTVAGLRGRLAAQNKRETPASRRGGKTVSFSNHKN
jgi:hypothetical protein